MSRTLRRRSPHLIRWWLPDAMLATRSKDPWRALTVPGMLYSKEHPKIVRILQTDMHRFFAGPGMYYKKKRAKMVRQAIKSELRRCEYQETYDDFQYVKVNRCCLMYQ